MRRVSLRLLPFIFILYICSYLDRTNVAVAALQMKSDLKFSSAAFGLGSSTFFLGYALCEVPSNLLLTRVGARWWIARIMVGDPGRKVLMRVLKPMCGRGVRSFYLAHYDMDRSTPSSRQAFMVRVRTVMSRI